MKKLLLGIFIPLIAIQFIRMDVPATLTSTTNNEIDAPQEVMSILKRACYDCHSNALIYPWYSKIVPLSWYTKTHVKNGRKVVNFSEWKGYNREKQFKVMDKLPKSLLVRMPLPDYLWLHEEAKLSDEDRKFLSEWGEELLITLK